MNQPNERTRNKPLSAACEGAGSIPSEAMITAYLTANDAYWQESDAAPRINPGKWRNGTPREATRVSLRAALAVQDYAVAIDGKRMYRRGKEYAPVPSEGIASVAASDAIAELEAAVIHHEMNKKAGLGIVSAQRLNDARVVLRAALKEKK